MNLFFTSYFSRCNSFVLLCTIFCLLPIHAKREWVGTNPSEMAPGSKPLGSMKKKFFNNDKIKREDTPIQRLNPQMIKKQQKVQ